MNKKLRWFTKIIAITTIVAILTTGCGNKQEEEPATGDTSNEKATISMTTIGFTADSATEESTLWKEVEKLTNTELEINFVPQDSYKEKFNVALASGELPDIIFSINKGSTLISAAQAGAFWEIGPYLKDYKNLSQVNSDIMKNLEVDGKQYALYRQRPYGRNGMVLRQDWLDKLSIETPKTIDDLYNVIKAFTEDDPDGNGQDDTYGLQLSKGIGKIIQTMATWFDGPNGWGLTKDEELVPAYITSEYFEAMNFVKKLYDEGLVNDDFAVAPVVDGIETGEAGMVVGTVDDALKYNETLKGIDASLDGVYRALAGVENSDGEMRVYPSIGYSGMFLFPKSSIKDETELKRILQFLDDLCSKEAQILINNGIEDRNYKKDGDGVEIIAKDGVPQNERNDLEQIGVNIPENLYYEKKSNDMSKSIKEAYKVAGENAIADLGAPYISKTQTSKGAQLDKIISDATIKYIVGQMDEKQFKEEIKLWRTSGGDDMIKEMTESYKSDSSKIKPDKKCNVLE